MFLKYGVLVTLACLAGPWQREACAGGGNHPVGNGSDHHNHDFVSSEEKLLHELMAGTLIGNNTPYHDFVRPVEKASDTVTVQIGMSLINLQHIDLKNEWVQINVFLKLSWTDFRLAWDPKNYDGITDVRLPASKLWLPDIELYNAVEPGERPDKEFLAMIYSNGAVHWIPHWTVKFFCNLDFSSSAHNQTCTLKMGSWTYSAKKVNLNVYAGMKTIDMNAFTANKVWDIWRTTIAVESQTYDCCPDDAYETVNVALHLTRLVPYFSSPYLWPSALLASLIPLMFLLPARSNQKITLGIGINICNTILLLSVESSLPNKHGAIPNLPYFLVTCFVLVNISLLMTTILMVIADDVGPTKQLPGCLRRIVLGCLTRVFCISTTDVYNPSSPSGQQLRSVNGNVPDDMDDSSSLGIMEAKGGHHTKGEYAILVKVIDRLLFILFSVICSIFLFTVLASQ